MTSLLIARESAPEQRYSFPVPYGWYRLMLSDELQVGEVQTVRFFGQEWVLFRDANQKVGMFEPHCPHLGAHLGVGGKVDGELLRCPFHNWGFDHQGFCRQIPYARSLSPKLTHEPVLKGLPVIEANRMIWAWFHRDGTAPMWEVPNVPEARAPGWLTRHDPAFEIRTIAQEIAENSVDAAHLKYVHGQEAPLDVGSCYTGHLRTTALSGPMSIEDSQGQPIECEFSVDFEQSGPGIQVVRLSRHVSLVMLITITPVEAELTHLQFSFLHPDYGDDPIRQALVDDLIQEQIGERGQYVGVVADLPIWNNKIYHHRPLLCDGDGKIMEFRRWFSQFYE
ncbi:Rieske 2Fe-2S domain-containing protein [Pseudomonas vancouverensis]|uniref:Rieske (2Fe-2S) protein n=1 Tax=Pseudomonas vancouverensis TaxID=95300 RepID=A0A1H2MKL6_PSEVA|nr:Rieske 2Fe-2S domain-containing protein [Pseudomonas vancouverensis]KAB0494745.1 Rieske (2Fe-2S) protein [Pseudomonas vancouverensis]TDB59411.1 Rieske (2Fe-2S) protein [Pseudomonas vancouverensis]SDU93750.1 Rieske [2Fe-2S] domain-containing protein [Pseudomonas vancouverensis]